MQHFQNNQSYTIEHIAKLIEGKIKGDSSIIVKDIAPFDHAVNDTITFAIAKKFKHSLNSTKASAIIVSNELLESEKTDKALIGVNNPYLAFAKVSNLFHGHARPDKSNISSSAFLGQNFKCGQNNIIYPGVVVLDNVTIGNGVVLHPNVVLEDNVIIGDDTIIYPNVSILKNCIIGNKVIIHSGTVIGSDGFGFAPDEKAAYHKIIQMGIVQIDDDVEIGANNCIDRAAFGKTWIKKGVKTDNLVHIAHNITIGENTIIVAQVGIAGSTKIGNNVVIAGQAGIGGHLNIEDNVTIGPKAGVTKSLTKGEIVSGVPEMPHKKWLRVSNIISKLPDLKKQVADIDKKLNDLLNKS